MAYKLQKPPYEVDTKKRVDSGHQHRDNSASDEHAQYATKPPKETVEKHCRHDGRRRISSRRARRATKHAQGYEDARWTTEGEEDKSDMLKDVRR